MKQALLIVGMSFALVGGAHADPAIFRDNILSIENGVVIGSEGNGHYYGHIQFRMLEDGSLELLQASPRVLAGVGEVTVVLQESSPVKAVARVKGYTSVPCVELEPPGVSYKSGEFTMVLAETPLTVACVTAIAPFERDFPLDIKGLPAGDYVLLVNGVEAGFTLESDN